MKRLLALKNETLVSINTFIYIYIYVYILGEGIGKVIKYLEIFLIMANILILHHCCIWLK